ncbi:MAG TPA: hypothetical protein VMX17_01985 [Candidatus Glassbacteria bacterium]|nr:hypothetical protein [Candidatus Glassbacteria bacterium]
MKFRDAYHVVVIVAGVVVSGHVWHSTAIRNIDFHYHSSDTKIIK